ncbi:hypothetical protein FVQ98_02170 [Ottowia sp. GY511]|uniref:hypothetical protein n=1 Tax=Ottowia sp. GY511 TaxID=2603274 RepID=UPI0011D81C61|nr:hypothetical protein [Ottowia sp. GY511]TXK33696.1 hypothetical protein FVQ98_02170 [Ottowia sp. GY511]
MALTDPYKQSRALGELFNEVGQSAVGLGYSAASLVKPAAGAVRFVGENAFTGPVQGGRRAQLGAVGDLSRVSNGIRLDPRLPEPGAGLDYTPQLIDSSNPRIANSHRVGYAEELRLANELAGLPETAVVMYGNRVTLNGADVISLNTRTGEVTLWDNKFRSALTSIKPSNTFKPSLEGYSDSLRGASEQAQEHIRNSTTVSESVRLNALEALENGNFSTNTVGSGGSRNSNVIRFVNGLPVQ